MPVDISAFDLDYDFYGVSLQARIQITRGGAGKAFDPNDPTVGGTVPDFIQFLYRSLESIRVEEQMGTVSTIDVSFSCPYDIALKVLESPYIQVTNVLHVRWGYSKAPSQMRPWLSGIIVAPPRVQLGPTSRIAFTANGWGHTMMRQSKKGSAPSKEAKDKTARGAFLEILTEYNFDPDKQFNDKLATKGPEDKNAPWLQPLTPAIDRATLSDYGVLRTIVDRVGCDFFVSGNLVTVALRDRAFIGEQKRARFQLYGQINPRASEFPMQNFELLNADALFMPAAQVEVQSTYMNAATGEIETVKSTTASQLPVGGRTGPDLSAPPASSTSGGKNIQKGANPGGTAGKNPVVQKGADSDPVYDIRHLPGVTDQSSAVRREEVAAKARVQAMYTQVAFDALGVPWMVPELVIDLAGVGIFNGSYMTQTVEHNIGRNGYTMHVEALSRTSSQALLGNAPAQGGLLFLSPKTDAAVPA